MRLQRQSPATGFRPERDQVAVTYVQLCTVHRHATERPGRSKLGECQTSCDWPLKECCHRYNDANQDDDYGQSNVDDDDDDVGSYYEWSNDDNDYYIDVAIDYDNDDYDDDTVSVDDDDDDDKKAGYGRQLGTISWIKWTVYNHCVNGKVYTRHCTVYQPYGQNSLDRTKCRSSVYSVQCTSCALIGKTQETRLTEKMSEIRRRQAELYCAGSVTWKQILQACNTASD